MILTAALIGFILLFRSKVQGMKATPVMFQMFLNMGDMAEAVGVVAMVVVGVAEMVAREEEEAGMAVVAVPGEKAKDEDEAAEAAAVHHF